MARITLYCRTTSARGTTNLRFRVTDGRYITLYYSTGRKIPNGQLAAFTPEGALRPGVTVYDANLKNEIENYMAAIEAAYGKMKESGEGPSSAVLQRVADNLLRCATTQDVPRQTGSENLVQRLRRYIEEAFRDGTIGEHRHMHYDAICRRVVRFLAIKGRTDLMPWQFDADLLMDYRAFVADEYLYVPKYPKIYVKDGRKRYPTKRISNNSVVLELSALKAFFDSLVTLGEIAASPLRTIPRDNLKSIMKHTGSESFYLTEAEFRLVLETAAPPELLAAKDIFTLDCCIGARISDMMKLDMDCISVSPDGIPCIRCAGESIPLIRTAYEIIMRTRFGFNFQETNYSVAVYNRELRKLLKHCGIDRPVTKFNEEKGINEYFPLCEVAGSRLARKTYLFTVSKMQVTPYRVNPDLTLIKRGRPKQAQPTVTPEPVQIKPRRGRPRKMKEDGTLTSNQTRKNP